MKRILNLLLLLGFVLLQGIAPLAHAHTGNSQVRYGIHLPGMQLQHGHAQYEYCAADRAEDAEYVLASQGVYREESFDSHDAIDSMPLLQPMAVATAPALLSPPLTAPLASSQPSRLLPFQNAPPRM